jgi:acetyl-CoA C-acetyltransferase
VGRTLKEEDKHPELSSEDRITDVYVPMGLTAENVAERWAVSREDMDTFAAGSHRRAVVAGNSCSLNDGAVAAVLVDEQLAECRACPYGLAFGTAVSGVGPAVMGVGPIDAVRRLLDRAGIRIDEVDIVELNEAFASQVLAVSRALGIDLDEQLNPYGGARALGHPFGLTGLRLTGLLLNRLETTGGRLGIATLCVGGGQGMAVLLERV